MTTDLKSSLVPRTVPEILNTAIRFYREQFSVYLTLMVMVVLPLTTIGVLVDRLVPFPTVNSSAALDYSLIISLYTLVSLLIQSVFITGPITYIASEQNLGRSATMAEAFSAVGGRLVRLGAAMVIFYGLLFGLILVSSLLIACVVGLVGLALVFYLSITGNGFIAPAVVLENQPATAAILRAVLLARTRFWAVFGLFVIVAIISLGISTVVSGLLGNTGLGLSPMGAFVILLIEVTVAALAGPIMPIAMTLMYYDMRIRSEALNQQPRVNQPNFRPEDVPAPPLQFKFERQDGVNIGILTVGLLAFSMLLALLFPDLLGLGAL